jgi:hypothetical protein
MYLKAKLQMNNQQALINHIKNDQTVEASRLIESMLKEQALRQVIARRKTVAQEVFNKVSEQK